MFFKIYKLFFFCLFRFIFSLERKKTFILSFSFAFIWPRCGIITLVSTHFLIYWNKVRDRGVVSLFSSFPITLPPTNTHTHILVFETNRTTSLTFSISLSFSNKSIVIKRDSERWRVEGGRWRGSLMTGYRWIHSLITHPVIYLRILLLLYVCLLF